MVGTDVIVEALEQATKPEDPPAWFEVIADEVQRTVVLIRHEDMTELFGWICPTECDAVAVVGGGWGRPEPLDAEQRVDHDAQRVRVIVVVDRDGAVGSRTTLGDGVDVDDGCRGGRLFDALHRCLGLATEAAPVSSAALIGDLWLAAVVAHAHARNRRLGWKEVAALHPACQMLAEHGHTLSEAESTAVIRVAPQAWTWDHLHDDTISGGGLSTLIAPEVAAWMDAGMFARWTLDLHGDPRALWGRAAAALDEDAVLRLADALDEAEARAEGTATASGTCPNGPAGT